MFEFHKYDKNRPHEIVRPPAGLAPDLPSASHASIMLWTEHCTECTAPACYRTCDLYADRGDGHCRRFEYGMFRSPEFRGLHGPAAQITFKRWGKLDALGSSRLLPIETVSKREVWTERAGATLDSIGESAFRLTHDHRIAKLSEVVNARLARIRQRGFEGHLRPDAFLLSTYNPQPTAVRMQVLMYIEHRYPEIGKKVMPFRTECVLRPGYSTHEIPARVFNHLIESGYPFYVSLVPADEQEVTLVFLAADFVKFAQQQAEKESGGKAVKCAVFDLDNTLWDGILVETEEVRFRDGVASLLKTLDERGVLLSIASKNDEAPAMAKLKAFGVDEFFVCPQINWQPKSQNIRQIAKELNIGIDSLAFIDDSPFELDEVRRAVPEVAVFDGREILDIASLPHFQGSSSEEARNRRRYYQDAVVRDRKLAEAGGDYKAFLAECKIRVSVESYASEHLDRVAELVQRTNQLNFSGTHYTRQDLDAVLADPDNRKYVIRCDDRYGSYGLVGFCVTHETPGKVVVQDFMLSCRVQSKCVEHAFFENLRTGGRRSPAKDLEIRFRQTERNTPARRVLDDIGFAESNGVFTLGGSASVDCSFIAASWPAVAVAAVN